MISSRLEKFTQTQNVKMSERWSCFLPFNRSSPSNIWWHLRPRKAANKAHSRTYAELRISQFRAQNKLTISKLKPVKFLDRRVSPSVSLFLLFCKQIFTECSLHQKRTACLAYTFGVNALNWPKCHIFHVVSAKRGETPGVKLENLMMKCWHNICRNKSDSELGKSDFTQEYVIVKFW